MYFKDTNNNLHFLDSSEFEYLLPSGSVPITDEEAEALRPVPPAPSAEQVLKAQIAALEASITPRRVREAVLGTDNGWLAGVDAQIAELR